MARRRIWVRTMPWERAMNRSSSTNWKHWIRANNLYPRQSHLHLCTNSRGFGRLVLIIPNTQIHLSPIHVNPSFKMFTMAGLRLIHSPRNLLLFQGGNPMDFVYIINWCWRSIWGCMDPIKQWEHTHELIGFSSQVCRSTTHLFDIQMKGSRSIDHAERSAKPTPLGLSTVWYCGPIYRCRYNWVVHQQPHAPIYVIRWM